MGQRFLVRAACLVSAALFASAAWAAPNSATVDPSHGVVLVNRGKGFNQIKRPVKLRVGNSVMVGPEGAAVIAYNDGCTVNVKPGSVKSIDPISPCASGSEAQGGPDYTQHSGSWCDPVTNCVFWPVFGSAVGFIIYEAISP
jgi:hypothetical protein